MCILALSRRVTIHISIGKALRIPAARKLVCISETCLTTRPFLKMFKPSYNNWQKLCFMAFIPVLSSLSTMHYLWWILESSLFFSNSVQIKLPVFGGHLPAVTSAAASINHDVDSWCHVKFKNQGLCWCWLVWETSSQKLSTTFSSKIFSIVYSSEQTLVTF